MRHAVLLLSLAALVLASDAPRVSGGAPTTSVVSALVYVDYTVPPKFKVGDWVKYQVITRDAQGLLKDSHYLTVLIPGQMLLWGERCFYIETWTDVGVPEYGVLATLMSYSIFDDSLGTQRRQLYQRLLLSPGMGRSQTTMKRIMVPSSMNSRDFEDVPTATRTDTVGPDTVVTARGIMHAIRFVTNVDYARSEGQGDSTIYREQKEERSYWRTLEVPITHFARLSSKVVQSRKAWFVGRSGQGAEPAVENAGTVTLQVVDWGGGAKSRILPPEECVTFEQIQANAKHPAPPKPPPSSGRTIAPQTPRR